MRLTSAGFTIWFVTLLVVLVIQLRRRDQEAEDPVVLELDKEEARYSTADAHKGIGYLIFTIVMLQVLLGVINHWILEFVKWNMLLQFIIKAIHKVMTRSTYLLPLVLGLPSHRFCANSNHSWAILLRGCRPKRGFSRVGYLYHHDHRNGALVA